MFPNTPVRHKGGPVHRRHLARLLAVAGSAVVLAGCGSTISGKAVSVFDDPFKVGGLQAVDGTSGLRSDAEKPTRTVSHSRGGKDDEIAVQSISDPRTSGRTPTRARSRAISSPSRT